MGINSGSAISPRFWKAGVAANSITPTGAVQYMEMVGGVYTTLYGVQTDGVTKLDNVSGLNLQFWHVTSFKIFTGVDSSALSFSIIPDIANGRWYFGSNFNLRFTSVSTLDWALNGAVKMTLNTSGLEVVDGSGAGGNIGVAGTTGATFKAGVGQAAPPVNAPPFALTGNYGVNNGLFLADPSAWLLVNVAGVDYKIPLYA